MGLRLRMAAAAAALGAAVAGCAIAPPIAPPTPSPPSGASASAAGQASPTVSSAPSSGETPTPFGSAAPARIPPGTPACAASGVSATFGWQGAGGSMAGEVTVTNTGPAGCSLAGPPRLVQLRDEELVLAVEYRADAASDPGAAGAAAPFLLRPGARAASFLVWSNLCSVMRPVVTAVLVTLPDGSGPVRAAFDWPGTAEPPRCDFPASPSTLTAYAFTLLGAASSTPGSQHDLPMG